jgi:hypothetical protein
MRRMAWLSARLSLTGFLGWRLGGVRWTGRAGLGQVAVLELFRQIDNEASLLLQLGFHVGKPCFEFGNTSVALATSLARRSVHTAMLGISFLRSCASLRKNGERLQPFL